MNRREFIKLMSSAGALSMLGQRPLYASVDPGFTDYKALVCFFLYGGNDAINTFIPIGTESGKGYDTYSSLRTNIAVANTDLGPLNAGSPLLTSATGNPYYAGGSKSLSYLKGLYPLTGMDLGVNGVMPELATLINSNQAAVITTMGTLVEPVTRDEILAKTANLPTSLFAHNHQQTLLQTGKADNIDIAGWAGRIADLWEPMASAHQLGMNISYNGNKRLLVGDNISPLVLGTGFPTGLKSVSSAERQALTDLANNANANPIRTYYNSLLGRSLNLESILATAWEDAPDFAGVTGSYGEPVFEIPDLVTLGFDSDINGNMIKQVESVAKMIAYASAQGIKRQIFMVGMGGYDTHSSQLSKHPSILRELSLAMWKFQTAIDSIGMADEVTSFTLSDFGRSVKNNGDGTDHAWAGHHVAWGGAVNGGIRYGDLPDMTLEGPDDHGKKGRLIPKISADQYFATLAKWFGVGTSDMASILPNIGNFPSSDLGFMNNT